MVGVPPEVGPEDTAGPDLEPLREAGAPADLAMLLQSMLAASRVAASERDRGSAPLRRAGDRGAGDPLGHVAHRGARRAAPRRRDSAASRPRPSARCVPRVTRTTNTCRAGAGSGSGRKAGIAIGVILLLVLAGVALALVLGNKNNNANTPADTTPRSRRRRRARASISVSANPSSSSAAATTTSAPATTSAAATTTSAAPTTTSASPSSPPTRPVATRRTLRRTRVASPSPPTSTGGLDRVRAALTAPLRNPGASRACTVRQWWRRDPPETPHLKIGRFDRKPGASVGSRPMLGFPRLCPCARVPPGAALQGAAIAAVLAVDRTGLG